MSAKKTVELFYDVLSPYSWIAFEFLCRARNTWNFNLKFKPFLLAAIMKESGNRPPGMVTNKANYSGKDLHRLRNYYKIPMNAPADVFHVMFDKGSLSAQRLLTSASMTQPDLTEHLSRELWMRIWSRDEDITAKESLSEALRKVGVTGARSDELMSSIQDEKVKKRLKEVTDEAMSYGAFGAPMIVTSDTKNEKQMIFGSDRMEILASILGEKYEGPLTQYAASKL